MLTSDQYAALGEDALFRELGIALLGVGPGIGPSGEGEYKAFAKRWFESRRRDLQEVLCTQDMLARIEDDQADDFAILLGVLAELHGTHAVAAPLAALIVRRGLQAFCRT